MKPPIIAFVPSSPSETRGIDQAQSKTVHVTPANRQVFASTQVEFDAGKLGIWLCIAAETMVLAALVCAYVVFRDGRPHVFRYAHHYLNASVGGVITGVVLLGSFTSALAVRFTQTDQKRKLLDCVGLTLVCGLAALTLRVVEYSSNFEAGLLPGRYFAPVQGVWERPSFQRRYPEVSQAVVSMASSMQPANPMRLKPSIAVPLVSVGLIGANAIFPSSPSRPENAHIAFGLYYLFTGLQTLHLLLAVGLWTRVFLFARRGRLNPARLKSVDYGALWWHQGSILSVIVLPLLYLLY